MDIKALMDDLIDHGCILQSREALAQGIIEKHTAVAGAEPEAVVVNDITLPEPQAAQEEKEPEATHGDE